MFFVLVCTGFDKLAGNDDHIRDDNVVIVVVLVILLLLGINVLVFFAYRKKERYSP